MGGEFVYKTVMTLGLFDHIRTKWWETLSDLSYGIRLRKEHKLFYFRFLLYSYSLIIFDEGLNTNLTVYWIVTLQSPCT